jgi:hypothetical protein
LLYATSFLISIAIHWSTIYGISVSTNPSVSYASVFVPSMYTWKTSLDYGLLWIFQWDWIICALMYVIPAFVAVCDVQRLVHGTASTEQVLEAGIAIVALAWVGGPGAAISTVWWWRERKLESVEAKSGDGKKEL